MSSADTQGRAYQATVDSSDYTPSHRVTQKDTTVGKGRGVYEGGGRELGKVGGVVIRVIRLHCRLINT